MKSEVNLIRLKSPHMSYIRIDILIGDGSTTSMFSVITHDNTKQLYIF